MIDSIDVAEYILNKLGPMTAMKLQKLVYYCQAWHLAWTEKPLFSNKIEAWKNGPVIPSLYDLHRGCFELKSGYFYEKLKQTKPKSPFTKDTKDVLDRVIDYYGKRDPHWLSQLTHMEDPWRNARSKSTSFETERSTEEITIKAMFEYYSSLSN